MLMARKKIVFVIVEGPSDDEALGMFFTKYFENDMVYVNVMYKDITSQSHITTTNILIEIKKVVENYVVNTMHLGKKDIKEIIHIVDTDGAFIDDSIIIEDERCLKTQYTPMNIYCKNRLDIIKRNSKKRSIINKLINCRYIWNDISYSMYYMSCNLDHVLHDKINATDEEKDKLAHQFAKKYHNDLSGFINYISTSSFSKCTSYNDSWEFIKQDNNSLKRYTNLGICFKKEDL